jgi:hypothetical protein
MSESPNLNRAEMNYGVLVEAGDVFAEHARDMDDLREYAEMLLDEDEDMTPERRTKIEAALKEIQRTRNTAQTMVVAVRGYYELFKATLSEMKACGLLEPVEGESEG